MSETFCKYDPLNNNITYYLDIHKGYPNEHEANFIFNFASNYMKRTMDSFNKTCMDSYKNYILVLVDVSNRVYSSLKSIHETK